jgi:glycosyltransferase involved in cell wall biosynthesis
MGLDSRRTDTYNWLVVNQELTHNSVHMHAALDFTLCKSKHAVSVLDKMRSSYGLPSNTEFVGFSSREGGDGEFSPNNFDEFLHVAGKSFFKHTQEVLEAWLENKQFPLLTVVCTCPEGSESYCCLLNEVQPLLDKQDLQIGDLNRSNLVLLTSHLPTSHLQSLQERAGIHLCPSAQEGFGHYIHEARALGRLVITTDAPPMSELINDTEGILVSADQLQKTGKLGLWGATKATVTAESISVAVGRLLEIPIEERVQMGRAARRAFEASTERLTQKIADLVQRKGTFDAPGVATLERQLTRKFFYDNFPLRNIETALRNGNVEALQAPLI